MAAGAHDGSVAEPSFAGVVDHVDSLEDNALNHFVYAKTSRQVTSMYSMKIMMSEFGCGKSALTLWRLDKLSLSTFFAGELVTSRQQVFQ